MMNRRMAAALLACGVLGAALSGCNKHSDVPIGMQRASGEAADYDFFVPEEWQVDIQTGASAAYFSANDPSSVSVMAWSLPNTDSTLEDWWDTTFADTSLVFQELEMEAEEDTTLDGARARSYVYSASLGSFRYRIRQVAAVKNGDVYLFTYTSTPEHYDTHTEEVSKMLDCFRFR